MQRLRVVQKIRMTITGHPDKEPEFKHEGPEITRWITGGPQPTAYVKLQEQGDRIVARCPICGEKLGTFAADYGNSACQEIGEIRKNGVKHYRQHKEC